MTEFKTYSSRMRTKGRITIPAELRKKLRLRSGIVISLREENGRLVLIPFKHLLDEIQGSLKPGPGGPSAFEMLFEERRRERTREDLKG